jgi:type II secretory pathway component PulK
MTTRSKPHPRGFALIITLLMMILLTVVAVSLLSLSSISLRASSQNQAQAQAQANARLALMLALGKLQESLGPDQNITAPSAIFDSDPNTPTNEGLTQHHLPALAGV